MAPEWDSSSTTSAIWLRAAARSGGHSAACALCSLDSLAGRAAALGEEVRAAAEMKRTALMRTQQM